VPHSMHVVSFAVMSPIVTDIGKTYQLKPLL
jgi:hypothetical protein